MAKPGYAPSGNAIARTGLSLTSRSSSDPSGEKMSPALSTPEASRRKAGRGKKAAQGISGYDVTIERVMLKTPTDPESSTSAANSAPRRSNKKSTPKKADDSLVKDPEARLSVQSKKDPSPVPVQHHYRSFEGGANAGIGAYERDEDENSHDALRRGFLGGENSASSIANELRRYSSMSSAIPSQLRSILGNLKQEDDLISQRMALEELSNLLLLSTEDSLAGQFSPDQFISELVKLARPSEIEMDNSETTILACRCIANLMEALPPSTANVVYGGAVPVLCTQLRNIMFIDNAEQALSVRPFLKQIPLLY